MHNSGFYGVVSEVNNLPEEQRVKRLEDYIYWLEDELIAKGEEADIETVDWLEDNLYTRIMRAGPNTLLAGRTHKKFCSSFLLQGSMDVLTKWGCATYTAPAFIPSKAGTKRVIYSREGYTMISCFGVVEAKDEWEAEAEVASVSD